MKPSTTTPITPGSRQDRHNRYGYPQVQATHYVRRKLGDPPGFYRDDVKVSRLSSNEIAR